MKFNKWTLGLAAVGVVSLASAARADEKMSMVQTALSDTTLSGYVDASASWMLQNTTTPGRTYDSAPATPTTAGYAANGFNLDVVSMTLDKPEDDSPWASGYHVQMLMGPGAIGRGTGTVGTTGDFSFNEAYVALRVPVGNGLDLHFGQFGTYNGYEAYDTYKDPNFSRSYGFYIESSAHTGVTGSYKISDEISVMAGVGNTVGTHVDGLSANSGESKAYLAMVTLTAPDSFGALKGATLSLGYTGGPAAGNHSANQIEQYYAGASIPLPVTGLALGLAYDYTANDLGYAPFFTGNKPSYAEAAAAYLTYATGNWTFADRLDLAKGSDGTFYANSLAGGGPDNELMSETFTVGYSLWKNVLTRAEFRLDHDIGGDKPFSGLATTASIAFEAVYQF
jgi:hypothetical protein